ncbi:MULTISPECIES: mandelate racemase/muconate lactonizing enzyme family protein [unclassified Caballeronia]|uniref:mandelate racemase/muconate lactonizing enzyme family protein n=1 Tax=unclassified Caballeronia TaxID=2646786 RepID=UPI0020294DE9|nr:MULTISPECIES: mandelate racemase/muconate lactonizing enzyme family protein [unclassified Caballeronia]
MKILDIVAYPVTVPVPPAYQVSLGIGRMVKRDTVIVKVITDEGIVGWGESHHGRAHLAVATLVNTTLKQLVTGFEATDVNGVWSQIYRYQLASHGMGAACAAAMSGIDMALWDIRGKSTGWPLYRLLGGASRSVPAYAGGICLGFQSPGALIDEVASIVQRGFQAVKLRLGDSTTDDIARVSAVREAYPDIDILTDVNTAYTLRDFRTVAPYLDAARIGWLEEPFPAHDYRSYREAKLLCSFALAAGENHFTRFEFAQLIEAESVTVLQPDISKMGGITELLKVAAMASAQKLPIHCHSSMGINMAATLHVLSAVENAGYFEADCSLYNPLRDDLIDFSFDVDASGTIRPSEKAGIGIEVNEDFIQRHAGSSGPGFV